MTKNRLRRQLAVLFLIGIGLGETVAALLARNVIFPTFVYIIFSVAVIVTAGLGILMVERLSDVSA